MLSPLLQVFLVRCVDLLLLSDSLLMSLSVLRIDLGDFLIDLLQLGRVVSFDLVELVLVLLLNFRFFLL